MGVPLPFLQPDGFTLGGEEGLRLARKNRADAVTLDVIMPTINSCAVRLVQWPIGNSSKSLSMLTIVDDRVTGAEREWLDGLVDRIRDKGVVEQLVLVADVRGLPAALIGGWRISA